MSSSQFSQQFKSQEDDCQDHSLTKIKLKTLQTKFITDLQKSKKFQSRSKVDSKQKKRKFAERPNNLYARSSKKTLKQISQQIKRQKFKSKSKGKNKVKFQESKKQKKKLRITSIDKTVASYDFYESIKQMAMQLIQAKKTQIEQGSGTSSISSNDSQNLVCGYTQKRFNDGTIFKGICQRGVMIKGQLHFKNGFIYKGQLFLDKFHGEGSLILPKGQIILGQWNQGQIVGKAQIKYPKGQIYYGDLKNYRRDGKGHLFFTDQSKYEGEFTSGQLTGYGIHKSAEGVQTEGYWFYGDYIGQNQQVYENVINNNAMRDKKKLQKNKDKKYVSPFQKQNIPQIWEQF